MQGAVLSIFVPVEENKEKLCVKNKNLGERTRLPGDLVQRKHVSFLSPL